MFRTRIFVAGVVVASAVVLATAVPAAAHDELLQSSPAVGEVMTAAPEVVLLSFADEVLAMGAAVIVVDQSGHDWVAAEPVLDEATVTAELEPGMPDAGYELRWRVVSSDGHPISGVIPFTIGDGEPLTRTPAPAAAGSADTTNSTDPQSQGTQENQGAFRGLLIGMAGAGIAVAVLFLVSFLRRRKAATPRPGGTDITDV
ncbi:MAG: copper resistance protein CopC [Microbacterium sp.]|uniref:copper resistance CopC family protein n=1 Tax=Microbacterium sp. TaxID=51671 RepID=UPI00237B076D|nr:MULTISPECIES: copper resistance CopC family protein [Microbacterium]MDO8384455.1 copper resistance protein CopC [Microbacterium sp.]